MRHRSIVLATLALLRITSSAVLADDDASKLKIHNKSKWTVHHFFMSPVKEDEWGPDQLRDEVIEPGESFELRNIPCATYDLKVVDEDGDDCVIPGEKFCGHEASWDLTSKDLVACESAGEEDEAQENSP